MNTGLSVEKIERLYEGIKGGLSRSQIAEFAGVSERVAVEYRRIFEETLPEEFPRNCGCGRPIKHQGRCNYRRSRRAETPVQRETQITKSS